MQLPLKIPISKLKFVKDIYNNNERNATKKDLKKQSGMKRKNKWLIIVYKKAYWGMQVWKVNLKSGWELIETLAKIESLKKFEAAVFFLKF